MSNGYFLSELCNVGSSKRIHLSDYVDSGIPFYRIKEIVELSNGKKISDKTFISVEKYKEIKDKFPVPKKNDILITAVGTIGEVYVIQEEELYFKDGNLIWLYDIDYRKIFLKYLYYWLKSDSFKQNVNNNNIGAVQKALTIDFVKNMQLMLPPLPTQQKIASLLSSLDEKIALNNRINKELEQMAKLYYRKKFLSRKRNGKLGDIINEERKSTVKVTEIKESNNGNYPFYTSGDTVLKNKTYIVNGNNCYLNTGGNAGIKFYSGKASYSTDTWCINGGGIFDYYLYLLLSQIIEEIGRLFFAGSGLKHLQKNLLKSLEIYVPNHEEMETFNSIMNSIFVNISKNTIQNRNLAQLRDWLLPMLMNGQVRIGD